MKIEQWPPNERPREKLLNRGADSLSDAELLAIFLRTGVKGLNAVELARHLLSEFGDLRSLVQSDMQQFCRVKGLGTAKYVQLQASIELSRRYLAAKLRKSSSLESPQITKDYLISELTDEPNEVFALLLLDSKYRVIHFKRLFYGTIDAAIIYPRVVVKTVLEHNAAAVILAHNHPSGTVDPSPADKHITRRLIESLRTVDVKVLDHIIVGDSVSFSFAEQGLI